MTVVSLLQEVPLDCRLSREEAFELVHTGGLDQLLAAAAARRDAAHGQQVSYSRKVFIPLTQLCRDVCHYCTFAHAPRNGEKPYLSIEQMVAIGASGQEGGGAGRRYSRWGDKPELRYRVAREELERLGHPTTLSYLAEAATAVFRETGLLPHINPGLMSGEDIDALRKVSVSQGIMLESISDRLAEKGGAHHGSRTKFLPPASKRCDWPVNGACIHVPHSHRYRRDATGTCRLVAGTA